MAVGEQKSAVVQCIYGSFGGFCGTIVGHPLDTIKVRLQTRTTQGLLTRLYAGIAAPLLCVSPVWGLNFFTYTFFHNCINASQLLPPHNSLGSAGFAGALSGLVFGICVTPVDVIKCSAQKHKRTSLETAKLLGVGNMWRGVHLTVLRDAPGVGVWFWAYELVLQNGMNGFWAGGAAGVANWALIFPVDTIKSRYQTDLSYRSAGECVRRSKQEIGCTGMYRGFAFCMVRSFLVNAAGGLGIQALSHVRSIIL